MQRECREVEAEEAEIQRQINMQALSRWAEVGHEQQSTHADPSKSYDLVDNVQRLSKCFNEVTVLVEHGGRYARHVHEFEEWVTTSEIVAQTRLLYGRQQQQPEEQRQQHENSDVLFIDPLSEEWHQRQISLDQKIRLLDRERALLPTLPPPTTSLSSSNCDTEQRPREKSALESMLTQLTALVVGMKEELAAMSAIEEQVLDEEKRWVERTVSDLFFDDRNDDSGGEGVDKELNFAPLWHHQSF